MDAIPLNSISEHVALNSNATNDFNGSASSSSGFKKRSLIR